MSKLIIRSFKQIAYVSRLWMCFRQVFLTDHLPLASFTQLWTLFCSAEDLAQGDAFIDNEGDESEKKREQNIESLVNKEIKRLMGDIFGGDSDSLEDELAKMIEFGDELDRLNSLRSGWVLLVFSFVM